MTTAGTAVVTGASRGIGLATSRALAAAGYRVAMLARGADALTRAPRARSASAPWRSSATSPTAVALDGALARVTRRIRRRTRRARQQRRFLLARHRRRHDASTTFAPRSTSTSSRRFSSCTRSSPRCARAARGHIVSIGSIADRVAFPENAAYAASKFGVRALHEVLRAELKGSGVRATLVSPSAVDTPLWDPVNPDERPGFTARREMLRAEAVAAAVMFAVTQPADVNVDELRLSGA